MDDRETGHEPQDTSTAIASSRRRGTMYQRAEWRHDREPASDSANQPARYDQTVAGAGTPPRAADLSPAEAPASVDLVPPVVVRLPDARPTPPRARRLRSSRRRPAGLALPSILFAAAVLIVVRLLWPSSATAPADSGIVQTASQPQPAAATGESGAAVPGRIPAVSQATNDAPPPASASRPEPPPESRTPPPATASPAPSAVTPPTPPAPAGSAAATLVAAQLPAVQSPAALRASVGQIRVTSNPAGARVTVNGIGWGPTPVTIRNLTLGPHTLRLTSDGYRSVQQTVQVTGDQPSATVRVTLRPAGQS